MDNFATKTMVFPLFRRQELRIAVVERGELLRGLRQAKVFNDELAKVCLI